MINPVNFLTHTVGKAAGCLLILCKLIIITASAAEVPPDRVVGQILVQTRVGASDEKLVEDLAARGCPSKGKIRGLDVHVISVPAGEEDEIAQRLSKNPNVAYAEIDRIVKLNDFIPNDPEFESSWHLQRMNLPRAWDITRGEGIVVAVLDTGIFAGHEDLAAKLVSGWNAVSLNSDINDITGHGTSVAGVIGAEMNNGLGVASIAPDTWIMPVRVSEKSSGWATTSAIARGLIWAADNGAHVANISYDVTSSITVANAAQYMRDRGGVVVVSAGNSGTEQSYADSPSLISVSATNSGDTRPSWSSYGGYVDVSAPGAGIWSTSKNGGYKKVSGTSFASPATAATVALIMSADPSLAPAEVENILEQTAFDLGPAGKDNLYGHGRVDALAAVELAWRAVPVDSQPPSVTITSPVSGASVRGSIPVDVAASDNVGVMRVELFEADVLVGTDHSAPYRFMWNADDVIPGSRPILTARAYDESGNVNSDSVTVEIADPADGEAPVIEVPPDLLIEATGPLTEVDLGSATASDAVDGEVPVAVSNAGPFTVGRHIVVWTATDRAGNSAAAEQIVTVTDTTPPMVDPPADLSLQSAVPVTGVELGVASATDLVDGDLVAVPDTSGPFPVGTTQVMWRATDEAGNTGTAIQQVTVSIHDIIPPVINLPADITIEATGPLTRVETGTASALDNRDGKVSVSTGDTGPFPPGTNLVIWSASDSAGNRTTAVQRITVTDHTPPVITPPADITAGATGFLTGMDIGRAVATDLVTPDLRPVADNTGPFYSGVHEITWTVSDAAGNSASARQTLRVLPMVNLGIDQTVSEGATVEVPVFLSGEAPDYPVEVNFSVAGTAGNPQDHNAATGSIRITGGTTGSIVFETVEDEVYGESGKTIVFALQEIANAVPGNQPGHTVTIIEGNVAPLADLNLSQGGQSAGVVYPDKGPVDIIATVRDPNPEDEHQFDWSQSDNSLVALPGTDASVLRIDPFGLAPGLYRVHVLITDNGIPAGSVEVETQIRIGTVSPGLSDRQDKDGDGIDDASEGDGDADQDGIADYLDAIDDRSILQGSNGSSDPHLLMTESGLFLRLGRTALAAGRKSAGLAMEDIADHGGDLGGIVSNARDSLIYPGGIYDFEIAGLRLPGQTVRVILPQQVAIGTEAVYRKYHVTTGWQDFVLDESNRVESAPGSNGSCPAPGDTAYRPGLQEGHYCVQLSIQDGGPNDADGLLNGVIRDPGGVGVVAQSLSGSTSAGEGSGGGGGGGCSVSDSRSPDPVFLLLLFGSLAGLRWRRNGRAM